MNNEYYTTIGMDVSDRTTKNNRVWVGKWEKAGLRAD